MMIKELTASVFIVRECDAGAWQTALIWHPRLECWLPAGGHVESGETAARAAVREAAEETGLAVTLVPGSVVPHARSHIKLIAARRPERNGAR